MLLLGGNENGRHDVCPWLAAVVRNGNGQNAMRPLPRIVRLVRDRSGEGSGFWDAFRYGRAAAVTLGMVLLVANATGARQVGRQASKHAESTVAGVAIHGSIFFFFFPHCCRRGRSRVALWLATPRVDWLIPIWNWWKSDMRSVIRDVLGA